MHGSLERSDGFVTEGKPLADEDPISLLEGMDSPVQAAKFSPELLEGFGDRDPIDQLLEVKILLVGVHQLCKLCPHYVTRPGELAEHGSFFSDRSEERVGVEGPELLSLTLEKRLQPLVATTDFPQGVDEILHGSHSWSSSLLYRHNRARGLIPAVPPSLPEIIRPQGG